MRRPTEPSENVGLDTKLVLVTGSNGAALHGHVRRLPDLDPHVTRGHGDHEGQTEDSPEVATGDERHEQLRLLVEDVAADAEDGKDADDKGPVRGRRVFEGDALLVGDHPSGEGFGIGTE